MPIIWKGEKCSPKIVMIEKRGNSGHSVSSKKEKDEGI